MEAPTTGNSRGRSSAYPSLAADFMGETGIGNGLVVIDEVDKESARRDNGRITDTRLQLLEPGNARSFEDVFFGFAIDCSALNWVLTANSPPRAAARARSLPGDHGRHA